MSGGGKGSKAPKAPDYAALAQQQGSINQQTAQQLTQANRPNQVDPFGNTITWSQATTPEYEQAQRTLDEYKAYVARTPRLAQDQVQRQLATYQAAVDQAKGNGAWTQTQTLTPETKAAWEDYMRNANQAASSYGGILNDYLSKYQAPGQYAPDQIGEFSSEYQGILGSDDPSFNGTDVANALYGSVMDRGRREQERETNSLTSQLRNSGLVPGSEAYNRAMQNLTTSHNDANLLAAQNATLAGGNEGRAKYASYLAGRGQGFGQDLSAYGANAGTTSANNASRFQADQYNRNQPLQELAGMAGIASGNPYSPTYQGFSGATGYNPTDLVGAAQAQYGAAQSKANANNSKKGGLLGAGASLGGSYLGSK